MSSSSRSSGPSVAAAPSVVHIVRAESGVMRIRQRPVAPGPVARPNDTPSEARSPAKTLPKRSSATLPMNPARAPNAPSPAAGETHQLHGALAHPAVRALLDGPLAQHVHERRADPAHVELAGHDRTP